MRLSRATRGLAGAVVAAALFLVLAPSAQAAPVCNITWDAGAGTTSWHTALNWDLDRVPTVGDNVCVAGAGVVFDTGTTTVATITVPVTGTLTVGGGRLDLSGTLEASPVAGRLTLNGGSIGGAGGVDVSGIFEWLQGTHDGTGESEILAAGRMTILGHPLFTAVHILGGSRDLRNSGGTIESVDGSLSIATGAQVLNVSGSLLLGDDFPLGVPVLRCSGACPTTGVTNSGTILKDSGSGTATVDVPTSSSGVFAADAGTLQLGTTSQLVTLADGATIPAGFGSVRLTNVTVSGTATVASGAFIGMRGTDKLDGSGTLVLHGLLDFFAGTMTGAGTLSVASDGRLNLYPSSPVSGAGTRLLSGSRAISNFGVIDYQDGPLTLTATAQLVNNSGGRFLVSDGPGGGAVLVCLSPCSASALINAGRLVKDAGTGTAIIDVPTIGSGEYASNTGTLQLGTSTRLLTLSDGASVAAGSGSVRLTNVLVPGNATIDSGAFTAMLAGDKLDGSGDLDLHSRLDFFGGTMTGDGTLTVASDGRVSLYPSIPVPGAGTRLVSGSRAISNSGIVDYQDGPLSFTGSGQLVNNSGGQFLVSDDPLAGTVVFCSGACGPSTLINAGRIVKDAGPGTATIDVPTIGVGSYAANTGVLVLGSAAHTVTLSESAGGTAEIATGLGAVRLANVLVPAAATTSAGSRVVMLTAADKLDGSGTLTVNGAFDWFEGVMQGAGTTTIATTGRLSLYPPGATPGAGTRLVSGLRAISNSGIVDYQDGPLSFSGSGQLVNNSGGQFLVSDNPFAGTVVFCSGACGAATLINAGRIVKDAGLGTATLAVPTIGVGEYAADTGTLALGTAAHTVTLSESAGGSAEIAPGVGGVRFVNVLVPAGATTSSGSHVVLLAAADKLDGAGTLTVNGAFDWFEGVMQGAGTTDIATAGRLSLYPPGATPGAGTRTLEGSRVLNNVGVVDYQDGPLAFAGTAQLVNSAGGQILVSDGPSGGAVLTCPGACASTVLINAGRLAKDAGTGIAQIDVPMTTSAVIDVERGVLSFPRGFANPATGTVRVHVGGTTLGSGYSRLSATGNVPLAGTLDIVTDPLFTPTVGDVFQVLTFASRTGEFGTKLGTELSGGLNYVVEHNPADVTLRVLLNQAPSVDPGGPYSVAEGDTVLLTGTGVDPEDAAVTFAWDLDNDGVFETPGATATFSAALLDGPDVRTVGFQACDPFGLCETAKTDITVTNVAPGVDAGADAVVEEASAFTGSGSFTDVAADTHTATVDYGDGTGAQPLALTGTGFDLAHTYADDGAYTVTVTVTDDDGGAGTDTLVVTVDNVVPVVDAGAGGTIDEGGTFTSAGSFTDPGADTWTATVDYGDGTGAQPLTLTGTGFDLSHTYADNGTYAVTVTVTDDDGGAGTGTTSVTVNNVVPTVDAGAGGSIDESGTFTGAGSFTDPGADTWSATVDYGDGTGAQPLALAGTTFALSHTYADDGLFTVTVTVTDDDAGAGSDTATVIVANVAPGVDTGADGAATEGATFTRSGTFTDPGADTWTATVNYGDGTGVQPLALAGNTFELSHAYADNGNYTVTVTVTDDDLGAGGDSLVVAVANVAPTVSAGADAAIDEGGTFTGDGSFTDPGADSWTATVDYGDGTGAQPLALSGTTFSLSHVYDDNGPHTVTVTVTDDDLGVGGDTLTVTVANVAPTVAAGSDASILEGDTFGGAGTFTDPGADTWTATVDYGDGTGAQPLALAGTTFALSHTYADDGTYTVTVTVTDDDAGTGGDTLVVGVANVAPVVDAGPDVEITSGTPFTGDGSFVDPGADTWTATVDYGDGDGAQPLALSGKTFSLSHSYTGPGPFTVTVTVNDGDATGTDTLAVTIVVTNERPRADAGADRSVTEGDLVALDGSGSSDPNGDPLTFAWTQVGGPAVGLAGATTSAPSFTPPDDGVYVFELVVHDGHEPSTPDRVSVVAGNANPSIGAISAPTAPVPPGTPVATTAPFTDPGSADTHTATWSWGDGETSPGTVGGGAAAGTHVYSTPGTYTVTLTVTDDDGGSDTETASVVVVAVPACGSIKGNGSYTSTAAMGAAGRAKFQLDIRCKKHGKQKTKFNLEIGRFHFRATTCTWTVALDDRASCSGTGELNGRPGYAFLVSAVEGTPDRLRIKIWNEATGVVVYDTQRGAPDDAEPTTAVSGSLEIGDRARGGDGEDEDAEDDEDDHEDDDEDERGAGRGGR